MKVCFGMPTFGANVNVKCVVSLLATQDLMLAQNIEYDMIVVSYGAIISKNRSLLIEAFLKTDATDLFFIDSDVGFPPEALLKILERPEDLVAGVYPNKTEWQDDYPLRLMLDKKGTVVCSEDGKLVEAVRLPTGFMRIKRSVVEAMINAYPELKWIEKWRFSKQEHVLYDLFRHVDPDGRWTGEDYAFCDRWRALGGRMWVYPDIDFVHTGIKEWKGNYAQYLMKQPKTRRLIT
jgi:hypothetical protein